MNKWVIRQILDNIIISLLSDMGMSVQVCGGSWQTRFVGLYTGFLCFSSSYCMGLDGHNAGKTLTRGTFLSLITIGMNKRFDFF